jgi:hypothetical protein
LGDEADYQLYLIEETRRHGWTYCKDNVILPDGGKRQIATGSSDDLVELFD